MGRRSRSRSRGARDGGKKGASARDGAREKRREKSPEERRAKRPAARDPSPAEEESSDGEAPAWASGSPSPAKQRNGRKDAGRGEDEDVSLEARVALLEVEVVTLKAENVALKKKLVEALKGPSSGSAEGRRGKPAASPPRRREKEPPEEPARRRREPSPPPAKKAPPPKEEEQNDEPPGRNAVMLANDAMEAYNESIANNIPPEKRLPLVNAKLDRYMGNFSDTVKIFDLKSGGAVIKDLKTFKMRYSCVFRESGAKLKGTCNKRFYYDGQNRPTYVVDFETHESLVTAQPGTRQDGSLGTREPRTEHLVVLYEEKKGQLTSMWLMQDVDKIGSDPMGGEEIVARSDVVKKFEAKIAELRGGPALPRIFNNYHEIPTVG